MRNHLILFVSCLKSYSTYSCQRWRNIATGSHGRFLWSQIHLAWPELVVTRHLQRCGKETLLSIAINTAALYNGNFTRFQEQLDPGRIERLSVLQVYGIGRVDDLSPWVSGIMDGRHKMSYLWQLHLASTVTRPKMPYSLTHFPKISDLRCPNILFHTTLPDPCLLTDLEISYSDDTPLTIVNFLTHCPNLQSAVFDRNSDPVRLADPFTITAPPITLPHLNFLEFGPCHTPFADAILRSIVCPTSSDITITIYRDIPRVLASFPETLESTLSSTHTLTVTAERIETSSTDEYQIDLSNYPFRIAFSSPESPTYFIQFNEFEDSAIELGPDMLRDLALRQNAFSELKKAMLFVRHLPDAKTLTQMLTSWKHVEDIAIRSTAVNSFIAALGSQESESGTPLCPSLRKLDIRGSAFDPYQLKDTLSERKAAECPVHNLLITMDPFLKGIPPQGLSVDEAINELNELVDKCTHEDGNWTSETDPDEGVPEEDDDDYEEDDPDEMYEAMMEEEYEPEYDDGGYQDDHLYDDYDGDGDDDVVDDL